MSSASAQTAPIDFPAQLARCDQEIAAMLTQPPLRPAWIVTLGIEDWEAERRIILRELEAHHATCH